QLRVVVFGRAVDDEALRGVKVALYDAPDATSGVLQALRQVGRVSVAQAEYFTAEANGESQDAAATRREWMWTPKWRARLRRIWIPTEFQRGRPEPSSEDLAMVNDYT